MSVQELRSMIQSGEISQVIDVRSPGEYASGHVPRAINIPLEELSARRSDIAEGPIAVICQSGQRASIACGQLADWHADLRLVTGGTQAWMEEGFAVTSSVASRWSLERQVRLVAGLMILAGTVAAALGSLAWIYLAMFVGAGLTFAGLTNICGMAAILSKLPWNGPAPVAHVTNPTREQS